LKKLLAHLEENLNYYNREELFLQGALKKLAQTLEDQRQRHGKVGCVKNLPREGELGHEQIF
jgi:hypothetical protein